MKSTYKLLGAFWDGLPCEKNSPVIVESSSKENASHLSLSRLLSFSSLNELKNYLDNDGGHHSIIVDADFDPGCNNKVVNAFFIKRISQMSGYLSQYYDEVIFLKSKVQ